MDGAGPLARSARSLGPQADLRAAAIGAAVLLREWLGRDLSIPRSPPPEREPPPRLVAWTERHIPHRAGALATVLLLLGSAGLGIVMAAKEAQSMFAASLVTASATARALRSLASGRITLVAMGEEGRIRSSEDEVCALYLRNLLEGRRGNPDAARHMILSGGEVAKFNDVNRPWLNPNDVPLALDIDRYNFAVRVIIEHGHPVARKFEA